MKMRYRLNEIRNSKVLTDGRTPFISRAHAAERCHPIPAPKE